MPTDFDGTHLLNVNEVGVGVIDVATTAQHLSSAGLQSFGASSNTFDPIGTESGLLIVVAAGRAWTPDHQQVSGQLPVSVHMAVGGSVQTLTFNDSLSLAS